VILALVATLLYHVVNVAREVAQMHEIIYDEDSEYSARLMTGRIGERVTVNGEAR
jgi:hypothetical protein